jgi:tetratricopeptide (TPR) repeat protein
VVDTAQEALAQGWQQQQAGNLLEAEQWYRHALAVQPGYVDALRRLGSVCLSTGRFGEAAAAFRQVLYSCPYVGEVHNDLGVALAQQGFLDEALGAFRDAIAAQPDYPTAHNNLALVFLMRKQPAEAAANARRAIELDHGFVDAHIRLGEALRVAGKLDEAIESLRHALRLQPDSADAHNNLGIAIAQTGQEELAKSYFRRAIELRPNFLRGYSNLGTALQNTAHFAEALSCYEVALQWAPGDPQLHCNRALIWLRLGDLERGWPEYEWRLRCPGVPDPGLTQPRWHGQPIEGRTILLYGEQGVGDTIHFIRYAPLVRQRGAAVLVACSESVIPLFRTCHGVDRLVASERPLPDFDVYAPLASLPGIFGTTLANVPAPVPYLSADERLVESWGKRLTPAPAGKKIGIAWQGSPGHPDDYRRSAPLSAFSPLAQLPGVRLFSLQRGAGSDQLQPVIHAWPITDLAELDQGAGAFMDTAAVMKNLDLVVTVDTAIAHLAGALAVPVYVALAYVADWRWLVDREDTPWYPTMRLFRQRQAGNWPDVFERIATAVARE